MGSCFVFNKRVLSAKSSRLCHAAGKSRDAAMSGLFMVEIGTKLATDSRPDFE